MGRLPVRLRLKDFRSSFWHERKAQAKTLSHLQETAALALQELPAGYCKRCYHKHIWPDRPSARQRATTSDQLPEVFEFYEWDGDPTGAFDGAQGQSQLGGGQLLF
jgi:hypothetical protein